MKKFGKFLTFVTVTGAAAAGLMYFLDKRESGKCQCPCDDNDEDDFVNEEEVKKERSYVKLNPEIKETIEETKEALNEGKETLKKAVKSAAQDIMAKAEDAAKGVGLVKEDKEMSDFEFEDFDSVKEEVKDTIDEAAENVADEEE